MRVGRGEGPGRRKASRALGRRWGCGAVFSGSEPPVEMVFPVTQGGSMKVRFSRVSGSLCFPGR